MEVSCPPLLDKRLSDKSLPDVIRNRVEEETTELINAANVPYFLTSMSKGFAETLPKYGGLYEGLGSVEGTREAIESADCVLWIGSFNVCPSSVLHPH